MLAPPVGRTPFSGRFLGRGRSCDIRQLFPVGWPRMMETLPWKRTIRNLLFHCCSDTDPLSFQIGWFRWVLPVNILVFISHNPSHPPLSSSLVQTGGVLQDKHRPPAVNLLNAPPFTTMFMTTNTRSHRGRRGDGKLLWELLWSSITHVTGSFHVSACWNACWFTQIYV